MVQLTSALLLALAASAVARHHFDRRNAQHHGHKHAHKARQVDGTGSGAPYPAGNATSAGAATGSVTSLTSFSTTTVAVTEYVTASAPPQANNQAAQGSGDNGAGAGAAPAGGEQCGPATVTVTAPASTVTVTAAAPAADTTTTTVAVTTSTSAAAVATTSAAAAEQQQQQPPPSSSVQAAAGSNPSPAAGGNDYSSGTKNDVKAATPEDKPAAQPANKQASPPANKQSAPTQPKIPTSGGTATSSGGGGKRGVGYNSVEALAGFAGSGVKWAHNWAMETEKIGLEFVPTLKDQSMLGDFESKCNAAIAGGSKALFTFNEPDMVTGGAGGTKISPEDAAAAYVEHVNPFAGKIALASPSITSDNATDGVGGGASGMFWLQAFLDACKAKGGCHVDIVNLHWYGNRDASADDSITAFKKYVTDAKTQVASMFQGQNQPEIWVSEFSAEPTADQDPAKNLAFLGGVLDFLDQNVDKYAYFMAGPGQLVDAGDTSKLSSLGSKYAS